MTTFTLFGADYSVYTRIPRLVLEEAGAPYRLQQVDIFADEGPPPDYLARHPFHKIPLLVHGETEIYETRAIVDYILSVTDAPLVPWDGQERARMYQIISIVDNYAYPLLIWDIYVDGHLRGLPVEPEIIKKAHTILSVLDGFVSNLEMNGDRFTLADCWLLPIIDYLNCTQIGRPMLENQSNLVTWWSNVLDRPSARATAFVKEQASKTS